MLKHHSIPLEIHTYCAHAYYVTQTMANGRHPHTVFSIRQAGSGAATVQESINCSCRCSKKCQKTRLQLFRVVPGVSEENQTIIVALPPPVNACQTSSKARLSLAVGACRINKAPKVPWWSDLLSGRDATKWWSRW